MFEKFSRSWGLVKASAAVLRSDRELLVFPLVSSIAALLVAATFVLPALGTNWFRNLGDDGTLPLLFYAWVFLFYLVQYFVIFFFNTALVGAAMIRLDGGDPTLRDGLNIALERLPQIFGYAVIAATVGMILRALEERAGFIGRIVIGMIGLAWTVSTFLVVPVLVARNVGPVDAVKESAGLLKRTWGENIIGNGGIGLAFGLLTVAVAVVGFGLAALSIGAFGGGAALPVLLGVLTVLALIALGLVQAALSGIYSAALYRYATEGEAPAGFEGAMLSDAFRVKG